nr:hypothetical protein [Agrobacterium sp. LAD9]
MIQAALRVLFLIERLQISIETRCHFLETAGQNVIWIKKLLFNDASIDFQLQLLVGQQRQDIDDGLNSVVRRHNFSSAIAGPHWVAMKLDILRTGWAKACRDWVYLGFQPVGLTLEDAAKSGKDEEVGAWVM